MEHSFKSQTELSPLVPTASASAVVLPRASVHVSVRPAVDPDTVHASIVEVTLVTDGDTIRESGSGGKISRIIVPELAEGEPTKRCSVAVSRCCVDTRRQIHTEIAVSCQTVQV